MSSIEASSSLPTTDLGWGASSHPYHPLFGSELTSKLEGLADPLRVGDTDCVSLQASGVRSEDRSLVSKLVLPGGEWTLNAVMDGHAGHECADYVTSALPAVVEDSLKSALTDAGPQPLSNATVSEILIKAISSLDETIARDILAIFPGGIDSIAKMTDEEIDTIVNDGGQNNAKILRGMRGTTVLVSLVDPLSENLWVASLGDCQAVLSSKNSAGEWKGTLLSSNHNAAAQDEVDRMRSEHPGEDEVIMNKAVVGALAVTRAIGDHAFKLPSIYATHIMLRLKPGFAVPKRVEEFMPRVITPPYVSNIADVRHVDLTAHDKFNRTLIIGSDGLHDVLIEDPARKDLTNIEEVAAYEARLVGKFKGSEKSGGNAALHLLRDALGGDDEDKVSQYLTLDMGEKKKWMDDITVLVQSL